MVNWKKYQVISLVAKMGSTLVAVASSPHHSCRIPPEGSEYFTLQGAGSARKGALSGVRLVSIVPYSTMLSTFPIRPIKVNLHPPHTHFRATKWTTKKGSRNKGNEVAHSRSYTRLNPN